MGQSYYQTVKLVNDVAVSILISMFNMYNEENLVCTYYQQRIC